MMCFGVRTLEGAERIVYGTNIVPAFPAGTVLTNWMVNGHWFQCNTNIVIGDTADMIVPPAQIRFAISAGAPKTYKGIVPRTQPPTLTLA